MTILNLKVIVLVLHYCLCLYIVPIVKYLEILLEQVQDAGILQTILYTRYTISRGLKKFTDGKCHLIGIIKLNIVDKYNLKNLKEAISTIAKDDIRGDWAAVRAYDPSELVLHKGNRSQALNREDISNKKFYPFS